MSSESDEASNPKAAPEGDQEKRSETAEDDDGEGGLGPALLAGAGILAVVAALVFWPSDDSDSGKAGAKGDKAAAAAQGRASRDGKGGAGAKGPGGVARRDADEATRRGEEGAAVEGKRNPAVRMPRGIGLAPGVPPEEPPPKFDNTEDEIAWYEAKLVKANTHLEMRRKATERLEKWRKKAEESDNATQELARYDQRAEVVNENFAKAKQKVSDIEKKIAELREE